MSVFEWTADLLTSDNYIRFEHHISMKRYKAWQKLYTWEALQNELRYGQSFCRHFDVRDNILYHERDQHRADAYIRKHFLAIP